MDLTRIKAALDSIEKRKARQRKKLEAAQAQLSMLDEEEAGWKRRILIGEAERIRMAVGDTRSLIDVLASGMDERTERLIQQRGTKDVESSSEDESKPDNRGDSEIVKITIRLTGYEKNCVERNVSMTLCRSLNDYCRKMLVDGYVIAWDTSGMDGLLKEVSYTNRSLNQIAKRINMLNSVYQGDMFDILQDWQKLRRDVLAAVQELKKICYLQQLQKPE